MTYKLDENAKAFSYTREELFDFFRIKKEETIDYRLDKLEEDVIAISNKLDLLITQLKIEFYKPEPYNPND